MRKRILCMLPALALAACAQPTPPKYDWGHYSQGLVAMDADPSTAGAYEAILVKIINNPNGKVPPGIYAEYGYMLQKQGDTKGAIAMYAREKSAWPESGFFMDKLIATLQTPQPKPAA